MKEPINEKIHLYDTDKLEEIVQQRIAEKEREVVDMYNKIRKNLLHNFEQEQIAKANSKPIFPQWMMDAFGKNEEEMQELWEECQRKEQEKMQLYAQLFNNTSHRFAMKNASILYHTSEHDVKEKGNED